eukprot:gene9114-10087_t
MEAGIPEAKRSKISDDSNSRNDNRMQITENTTQSTVTSSDATQSSQEKEDGKSVNGIGRKLESIIGRLSSDKATKAVDVDDEEDEEPFLCRADASTQTSPDFVKFVKALVMKRMKLLEQSLIGGAVADSVLNGKLAELHRENKQLREKSKSLQIRINELLSYQKEGDAAQSKTIVEVIESQPSIVEADGSSPLRCQSALVTPYNVHSKQGGITVNPASQSESIRPRIDMPERRVSQSEVRISENSQMLTTAFKPKISQPTVSRTGPLVKYVPHKVQLRPTIIGAVSNQMIEQDGIIMHQMPSQHSQLSSNDNITRLPIQPVLFTTPSVQVTGPRMSTLPPQQLQQRQVMQRPPHSSNPGLIHIPPQTSLPIRGTIRLQGQFRLQQGQPVPYAPQGAMPGFVTQGRPEFAQERILQQQQGQINQEKRSLAPLPAPTRNVPPTLNDLNRVRPGQLAPPSYQSAPRGHVEPLRPPRLQVNITVSGNGIVLSWDFESEMPVSTTSVIECYHLFASQDSPSPPSSRSEWKKIGVVKALPLPMACTLTQFMSGNSYHFAVVAVDVHGKEGSMSNPCTVRLSK